MDHYAAITQLQQLATFSPSYFIYHIFFDPGQSILRANPSIMPFYLKDLDFKKIMLVEKWSGQNGKLKEHQLALFSLWPLF